MPSYAIGDLRESLVIQTASSLVLTLVSLTRAASVATATTLLPHGRSTNDFMQVSGAAPAGYQGRVKITVTGPTTFTYLVNPALATPATTPGIATYATDAAGGRDQDWRTVVSLRAAHVPVGASERLQLQAMQAQELSRFRTYARADLATGMRVVWTPTWPRGAAQQILGITGIRPIEDARQWMWIDATRRAA